MGSMLVTLGILGWFSIQDLKRKSLSVLELSIALVAGTIVAVCSRISGVSMLSGILFGAVIYVISCCSREQIGKGDAILFIITGILLGGRGNLELFFIALVLAAVYAAWLLLVRHVGRKKTFAFVPFLAAAQLIRICLQQMGGKL